jgi:hypothetical protein
MMTLEDVPPRYRKLYKKAMSGKSRKAGIRAHCLMCVALVPKEAALCTATACPLFPYRQATLRRSSASATALDEAGTTLDTPQRVLGAEPPPNSVLAAATSSKPGRSNVQRRYQTPAAAYRGPERSARAAWAWARCASRLERRVFLPPPPDNS